MIVLYKIITSLI